MLLLKIRPALFTVSRSFFFYFISRQEVLLKATFLKTGIKSRYLHCTPSHAQSNQDVRNAAGGLFLYYKDWIYSDGWQAYNNLPNIGYGHERVIHTDNFVDPVTGVHTNGVEAYWSRAKQKLKSFQLYPKDNDNGEQQPSPSHLGESASNFEPYVPILLRSSSSSTTTTRRAISSNCYARPPLSSSAASSSSSTTTQTSPDKWQPLSKNQRRKRNKRNPPPQSQFLPPTIENLTVPAAPQPAVFPEETPGTPNFNYLLLWMNTYNPLRKAQI